MVLFPPSSNADYRGAAASAWFLALAGVMTILPGMIHYFLPDGGAGVIAHIDLSTRADTIVAIFAWYGAMQISFGILILVIALRYRALVPLVLLLLILMHGLSAFAAWVWKGAQSDHHPPEHYGSAIFVLLGLLFFVFSLNGRGRQQGPARGA
ncbi:MAG: hypothetical protein U1E50_15230 [Caulobacteraceae bacterium]